MQSRPDAHAARRSRRSTALSAAAAVVETLERRTLLSGVLDTTFGTRGYVNTSFAGADQALATAVQADGKIVVVGSASTGNTFGQQSNFAVARYNADGTPDAAFGTGGKVQTDFNGVDGGAEAAAVLADGRTRVGG